MKSFEPGSALPHKNRLWIMGVVITMLSVPLPATSAVTVASQTLSLYRYEGGNETMVAYTALGSTGTQWRARGSVSWWRWNPDDVSGQAAESGIGTLDLTLGRSLWSSFGSKAASRGWAQFKGTIPLANDPSPLSSGEIDWGGSLLTTNRYRDFLFFAELGYLNPGDPVGIAYHSRISAALSTSWHHPGFRVYPVASFAGGGSIVEGSPGFGEWSAGIGTRLGGRTGVLLLYTRGTTSASPDRGLTMIVNRRL